MKSYLELRQLIDQRLDKIEFLADAKSLYSPIEYILSLKAKRIRPVLLLMAHQLFSDNLQKAMSPAIGIEIFHNFTLLHDDIMDNASVRRGYKTVHEKWNNNTAILSGDAMLIESYKHIIDVDNKILNAVLAIYNNAAIQVCIGQKCDMDFENQKNVTISEYIKMIEYKTAVLIAASMQIGGLIAGTDHKTQEHLFEFGKNIGIAFQLKDDLLDVFGSKNVFGKEVGGDIKSNKKTYLFLKALEVADGKTVKKLNKYYSTFLNDNIQKINNVKEIFLSHNIIDHTNILIKKYHDLAMENLEHIDVKDKDNFYEFSNKLLDRIN
ncbi:MAG: isoprenyl synthetase [Flavobacteriales bacterium]|nr:isoprenyl synthetase [Flavobacteriales bacterium]